MRKRKINGKRQRIDDRRNHRPGHEGRIQVNELCKDWQRTADALCSNHRAEQCGADDKIDRQGRSAKDHQP